MSSASKFQGAKDFNTFTLLFASIKAALKGDWQVAKDVFDKYPNLARHTITDRREGDNFSHRVDFVKEHKTTPCLSWSGQSAHTFFFFFKKKRFNF
jgi:hypothetical protein